MRSRAKRKDPKVKTKGKTSSKADTDDEDISLARKPSSSSQSSRKRPKKDEDRSKAALYVIDEEEEPAEVVAKQSDERSHKFADTEGVKSTTQRKPEARTVEDERESVKQPAASKRASRRSASKEPSGDAHARDNRSKIALPAKPGNEEDDAVKLSSRTTKSSKQEVTTIMPEGDAEPAQDEQPGPARSRKSKSSSKVAPENDGSHTNAKQSEPKA